uniref:Secreted protein n=1 Tax=Falco tinnunculus TaxID=100819 RepID=A0A8C4XTT0_FALTI
MLYPPKSVPVLFLLVGLWWFCEAKHSHTTSDLPVAKRQRFFLPDFHQIAAVTKQMTLLYKISLFCGVLHE